MQATMEAVPMSYIFRFSSPSVRPLRRRTRDDPGAKGGRTWYVSAGRAILSKFFGIFPTFAAVRIRPIPLLFALLALLLMTACRGRYPSSLLTADSLASACPDSALRLLRALEPEMKEAGTATRMYYNLLCIKAEDKAYVPHASDSAVQEVLRYYVDRNDRRHLPEAYYYAGRVASDLGDTPQALDYFEHALEVLPREDMLPLRSRVLSQMGTLFYRQGMYPEALNIYKKNLSCDSLLGDSAWIISAWLNIGLVYKVLNQPDSTRKYYQLAYQFNKTLKQPLSNGEIEDKIAWTYLNQERYDSARIFIEKALKNATIANRTRIYTTAGIYYHSIGQTDSASWYYHQLLRTSSIHAQIIAYGNLSQIALQQEKPKLATCYLLKHNLLSDSLQKITNTESIRKTYALYNYQLRERENEKLQAANEKKTRCIIYLIVGAGFLFATAIFYYQQRQKRWNTRLLALEQLKNEIYQRSEQYARDNTEKIHQLTCQLQDREQTLQKNEVIRQQLEKQISLLKNANLQIKLERDRRETEEYLLFHSEIYQHFRQQLQANHRQPHLTPQDWKALQSQIDKCYNNFTSKLNGPYQLDDRELHVCLLIKLKFSYTDIGKLVNLSLSGVNSVRRRLYYKVFGQKGEAKDWDNFIISL